MLINIKHYKILNPDLSNMSDDQAYSHYCNFGKYEQRETSLNISNDTLNFYLENIINPKKIISNSGLQNNTILLINHYSNNTGAPKILFNIHEKLLEQKEDSVIIDVWPNPIFKDIKNMEYHFNQYQRLKKIFSIYKPKLIISNSLNIMLFHLYFFEKYLNKTIFYLHETYNGFIQFTNYLDKNLLKKMNILVVSEKIKNDFISNGYTNVNVQKPFLLINQIKKITTYSNQLIKNQITNIFNTKTINFKKIIICMCGTIDERKNFGLFLSVAAKLPDFEFIWIGGKRQQIEKYKDLLVDNFFYIENTNNPYAYFNISDYFFLCSKEDPCPIVVLENLLLNKKIIVLENNIWYDHPKDHLENYLIIDNHHNDAGKIAEKIKSYKLSKKPNQYNINHKYVLREFVK